MEPTSPPSVFHFKEWLESLQLRRETIRAYSSRVSGFLRFRATHGLEGSAWQSDIGTYIQSCAADGMKSATLNGIVTALDNYFLFASGCLPPRSSIEIDQTDHFERAKEVHSLFAVLKELGCPKRMLIFHLMLYERLSAAEIIGANLSDLGFSSDACWLVVASWRKSVCHKVHLSLPSQKALFNWLQKRHTLTLPEETALLVNDSGRRMSAGGLDFLIKSVGWKAYMSISSRTLTRRLAVAVTDNSMQKPVVVQAAPRLGQTIAEASFQ